MITDFTRKMKEMIPTIIDDAIKIEIRMFSENEVQSDSSFTQIRGTARARKKA